MSNPGDPDYLTDEQIEQRLNPLVGDDDGQGQLGVDPNQSNPQNNVFDGNNSLFSTQQPFPTTLALQGELFILKFDFIDEDMAIEFYEQAMRYPHLKINDCMQKQAIQVLNLKIMCDTKFSTGDPRERHDWQNKLTIVQIATLV